MSSHTLGILIGGLLPAFAFTAANIAAKSASQAGISIGWYIVVVGIGVLSVGSVLLLFTQGEIPTSKGVLSSLAIGIPWALGMMGMYIALTKYDASIGVLATFFNLNTLFTVLLALWLYAEWKQVRVPQLLVGSCLMVLGSILVSRS